MHVPFANLQPSHKAEPPPAPPPVTPPPAPPPLDPPAEPPPVGEVQLKVDELHSVAVAEQSVQVPPMGPQAVLLALFGAATH